MKLSELVVNQIIIVQLVWGEQQIEFMSTVVKNDGGVFITPYYHNGSPLDINVTAGKGVVCNLYADEPKTKKRISWKNVELTTVIEAGETVYCLKTSGFNENAKQDERREHERIIIRAKAMAFDGLNPDGIDVLVHDISDVGVSFYAPTSFEPKTSQVVVKFIDHIGDKLFDVRVDCAVIRMINKNGNILVGCRVVGENKAYKLYGFMKRLNAKKQNLC